MFVIESGLALLAVLLAFVRPQAFGWSAPIERGLARLAKKRALAVAVTGFSALVLRVALLPVLPIPQPDIHDEFSYLLMADTFAHGRVTNPTHPMWIHFETFHVNQIPTYASMYYPAQGLFLAAGQVVFGHPFWGVLLSVGLMCAATCWMLQGWLPPLWALLGGMLIVTRLGSLTYWANSYWGGAVAALGGALVVGALPRIRRYQRVRDALIMGLGLAILGNSRPYESIFFCLPISAALVVWAFGEQFSRLRRALLHIGLPVGIVVSLTLTAMGYYFWRTTGSPFRTGYSLNMQTYNFVYFPWETLKPEPSFHYPEMRNFYLRYLVATYNNSHSLIGFGAISLAKLLRLWLFFVGPILSVPILVLVATAPYGLRYKDLRRKTKFLLGLLFVTCFGLLLPVFFNEHYAAPLTSVVYAVVLIALQRVRCWRRNHEGTGLALVRAVTVVCVAFFLLSVSSLRARAGGAERLGHARAGIESQLTVMGGNHMVIVRYAAEHDPLQEWVFNTADIDSQRIIWARDLEGNGKLIQYFHDRHVWLLEPDQSTLTLKPFSAQPETKPGKVQP
jgi:hypothetical protein